MLPPPWNLVRNRVRDRATMPRRRAGCRRRAPMKSASGSRPTRAAHGPRPAAFDWRSLPWKRIVPAVVVIATVAALLFHGLDIQKLHTYAARLNGGVAFALLTLLPLVGFPVNVLHIAAGIRFGIPLGLTLVALSILLQLLSSYALVHLFRNKFEHWLAPLRARIPRGAHASICVFVVMLPGAPFSAINYVLPLIGVPLRTYLLCCLPLHALRSTVTVSLGGQSNDLTPARLAVLAAYATLVLGVSWWTYRRIRSQLGDQPSAANGLRRPASGRSAPR